MTRAALLKERYRCLQRLSDLEDQLAVGRGSRARSEPVREVLVALRRLEHSGIEQPNTETLQRVLEIQTERAWPMNPLRRALLTALHEGLVVRHQDVPCVWSVADRWHRVRTSREEGPCTT